MLRKVIYRFSEQDPYKITSFYWDHSRKPQCNALDSDQKLIN